MSNDEPLLTVENLRTEFRTESGRIPAVKDVSFSIERGESLGIVGESGAGKSVTAKSILDLISSPGEITEGSIRFNGRDILSMGQEEIRSIRGNEISMIFQDPMSSLNPSLSISKQISDVLQAHTELSAEERREKIISLLSDVGIPNPELRLKDYPHQFSGGMRQRVMIAMALACDPDLIIADEPTTALDATIQAQILNKLTEIQNQRNISILYISHDLGTVAQLCDRIAVMYSGSIIETGATTDLFENSFHPYTVGLMKSIPRINDERERLDTIEGTMPAPGKQITGCAFANRCPHAEEECKEKEPDLVEVSQGHKSACMRVDSINFDKMRKISSDKSSEPRIPQKEIGEELLSASDLQKTFSSSSGLLDKIIGDPQNIHAVDGVDLTLRKGETVGLVGESGCGKSTLGKLLTRIHDLDSGQIVYAGDDLGEMKGSQLKDKRSDIQLIFQDPLNSLNPRKTVEQIIARPLEIHNITDSPEEKRERILELLDEVGLGEQHLNRYPHEFSGGQQQRVGIARALAVDPDFIVADEPVSALDVSLQASILNLLMDIQEKRELSYLFIAHDLQVVQHISDRICVMYLGEIVESGTTEDIFSPPYHPYTEVLLSSIPKPDPTIEQKYEVPEGELPDPSDPPTGCRFHTRCPYAMPECEMKPPKSISIDESSEQTISCHLFDDEMKAKDGEKTTKILQEQQELNEIVDAPVTGDDTA